MKHFTPHSETARDYQLVVLWTAGLLIVGCVANLLAVVFG